MYTGIKEGAMKELNKSRIDFLKWWLVLITSLSGYLIFAILVLCTFTTETGYYRLIFLFLIVAISSLLIIAWKKYTDGNRKNIHYSNDITYHSTCDTWSDKTCFFD